MVSILFRCDGSPDIGLGHIVRCLALADELHDVHNCRITFAMRKGPLGIQIVDEKGYQVIAFQENGRPFDYKNWLDECIRQVDARVIVFDVRDSFPREDVKDIRKNGILVVTLDDPEDKRLEADLAFYPPVPQVKSIDWTDFTGKLYVGWEWVILRKEFASADVRRTNNNKSPIIKVLLIMGSSDPQGMTIKVVKALEMLDEDFEAVVVLGVGFQHKKQLDTLLSDCKHRFDVQENAKNMAELMAQSDLAVASFGVTAYELAAMKVPTIYLCLTNDHAESASAFVEEGMAICLGATQNLKEDHLTNAVRTVSKNFEKWRFMRDRAIRIIDGKGAERIATLVASKL